MTIHSLTSVTIRLATEADILAILAIRNQGIEDRIATLDAAFHTLEEDRAWFQQHCPTDPILVAELGGRVIGWASLSPFNARECYNLVKDLSIYIAREWRGKGVGSLLLDSVIRQAKTQGVRKIVLALLACNEAGLTLYRKFGFRTVGCFKQHGQLDGQWVDVVLMEKLLEPFAPKGPIVVKIGGSTLGSHDTTLEDLVALQKQGKAVVVVHGGGKAISEWLDRVGVPTRFVRGLRVTDADSLKVVVGVLAGVVNKDLVAAIRKLGGQAMGLAGVDGGLIQAKVQGPDLGLVGEITGVDYGVLNHLLDAGYIAVIAPIGLDKELGALNINADTVAGEVAAVMGAEQLVFLTDVEGVCEKSGKVIETLSAERARELIASGIAGGGMIPKIEACLRGLASASAALIIDGRHPHALVAAVEGRGGGTTIRKEVAQ
ncbi:MAG: acetylglutamate kinase [Chloroflexota bacterium]